MREKQKKPKLRAWVKIVIALIVLAVLFFIGKWAYGWLDLGNHDFFTGSTYSEDCVCEIDPEVEQALADFTNGLYNAERKLSGPYTIKDYDQEEIDKAIPDMSEMFEDPTGKAAERWQTSLKYLITGRALSGRDLKIDNIAFNFTYQSIEPGEDSYKITYLESASFQFACLEDLVSESYNMPCEMTFTKTDDGWKITDYYREDDFTLAVDGAMEMTSSADKAFDKLLKAYKKNMKQRAKMKKHPADYSDVEFDVAYDRDAALEYAKKYVKERNTAEWDVYDDLGGNCQNFGSQVMYAGGIPMDREGGAIWKYYDSAVDYSAGKVGRSASWTGAPYFRAYAKANKGFGLVATVDANLYSAEAGDILQVGARKGEVSHTNVVIGPVIEDDEVVDVLINSNTNNRINWPISASLSGTYSLIKIHGYNK